MKSKLVKVIVACVVAVAVCVGGYYGYNKVTATTATTAAVQYYSVTARKMNLQVTIQGTGAAYAASTKDVMPNNNGTLSGLSLKVGDTVTAGQTLFTADSDDLRKAVTTAQNNLTKANLTLNSDSSAEKVDANKVAMDQISVNDAYAQLTLAKQNLSKMTVTAPIGGVVTAVNNSNGDSVQSSKGVLTIVDMSSMKVKVSVDELDIAKVKIGQAAAVKFDAVKDKTFEGTVETIAQTGTSSNNVTTYDVVVAIKDPTGIKLGMNANITISVESKENALVIPAEALVEMNGQKFVRVNDTTAATGSGQTNTPAQQSAPNQQATGTPSQQASGTAGSGQGRQAGAYGNRGTQGTQTSTTTSSGKLIPIKTGLETENYIEVTEGVTEGQQVLVRLATTSSTTTNSNNKNQSGLGNMGNLGGMPQGGQNRPRD